MPDAASGGVAAALADGDDAGATAAGDAGFKAKAQDYAVVGDREGRGEIHRELPTDRNPGKAKAFIDFQNDVTAKDIRLAVREGFRSIEHVKRLHHHRHGHRSGQDIQHEPG